MTFGDRFAHVPAAQWVREHGQVEPIVRSDSLRLQNAVVWDFLIERGDEP